MANPTSRRKLAGAAALLAAFGSTAPFAGSAEAATESSSSKTATLEDYAAMEYEAWSQDAGGDLLLLSQFLPRAAQDHAVILMALAVMKRDHFQNATVAAQAPAEELCRFADALHDMSERYDGLAQLLRGAHVRVLAGMARNLTAAGEA